MPDYSHNPSNSQPWGFIATLGSEPQVVTATLDLLLARGNLIQEVIVVHSSPSTHNPVSEAVTALPRIFSNEPAYQNIKLIMVPVADAEGKSQPDIANSDEAQSAFQTLYRVIRDKKIAGYKLHVCIAGGRKTLAVFGMAAAQLLFDENDRLWHLYSAGEFLNNRRLHPLPGDDIHLIPIPVMLWSQVSPILIDVKQYEDPWEFVEKARTKQLNERLKQARAFISGSLTIAEKRAVRLLVQEGLSDSEIARRLTLSPRTVEQHLRSVYRKAANHWVLTEVTRAHLIALLNLYFSLELRENPHDRREKGR